MPQGGCTNLWTVKIRNGSYSFAFASGGIANDLHQCAAVIEHDLGRRRFDRPAQLAALSKPRTGNKGGIPTSEPDKPLKTNGADAEGRTPDLLITNQLLYH